MAAVELVSFRGESGKLATENSGKTAMRARPIGKPFEKGQSGNPAGRPP